MGSNTENKHICKTVTKIEAKRLRATTFAITKSNIAIAILKKITVFKG
jgi:hypothetical protein